VRWISLPVAISYTAGGVHAAGAKTNSHFFTMNDHIFNHETHEQARNKSRKYSQGIFALHAIIH
jgi:hypothetical protein